MEQMKREKKWSLLYRPTDAAEEAVLGLSREVGVSKTMAKLLYTRGYCTAEQVKTFLNQDQTALHDPYLLLDAEPAVERVLLALERGEKIAIYGDYDVDGVTSVSLLYLYLTSKGADVGYYIPSRAHEGYGLSKPAIDRLHERDVKLMITVDTGITAIEEIDYAKEIGIETVVTDHHECRDELPRACAVVNPHRANDPYPFKELAGVGVIFKLICACEMMLCRRAGESELDGVRRICYEYADLVAIGTIADVMPIVDENRLIVTLGLALLENTKRPGLRALIDATGRASAGKKSKPRRINSSFIGYVIAPRMNAAGRVSNASIAVELLLASDATRAKELAEELCELNTARQIEENRIADQAYQKIEQTFDPAHDRVIVIDDDGWQQGIIGIVSSRITERYGLPSILISFDGATRGFPALDDVGKGSGRSIKGMNLVEALVDSEELLVRFGGHELAAGLSVRRCNIEAFRKRINRYACEHLTEEAMCVSLDADCEVEMQELQMSLAQEISMLEPFGVANAVPNLLLRNARPVRIIPMGDGKHTKLILEKDGREMSAVWFNHKPTELNFDIYDHVDVLFQLNINEFQNVLSLQMLVQDIHLNSEDVAEYEQQRVRYEEVRAGGTFAESEDFLPTRDDMAFFYTLLRREYRAGHTVFSMRRILGLLRENGERHWHYAKAKFILRIMQELQICGITEVSTDRYLFEFYFHTTKTNLEKSSILHRLKLQMRRDGEYIGEGGL